MEGTKALLLERQEDRKAALDKKKTEREETQKVEESEDYFRSKFTEKKREIAVLMEGTGSIASEKLGAHFDELAIKCQGLGNFLADSAKFISAYSLEQFQQQISKLQRDIDFRRYQLMPRKKFAFKSRKKQSSNPAPAEATVTADSAAASMTREIKQVGFTNKSQETLTMDAEELEGQDVNLGSLRECEVRLTGSPGTLHVSQLTNCRVFCGPVCSSVFVSDCTDCTFLVACQQLRIHTTSHSSFYVHVTSRSIIEDCSTVTFAPYSWTYPGSQEHFKRSGLDGQPNNWRLVDDFNWLSTVERSPNWSELAEQDRHCYN